MEAALFHPRQRSLLRGNLLVLLSMLLALWFSDFPNNRATPWMLLPAILVLAGTADTARCIRRRWNLQHAAVILCLYMDLMAATMVFFALLYPWLENFRPTH